MNYKTDVDLKELEDIRNDLKKFIDDYNQTLQIIKKVLVETETSWDGNDYKQFKMKYDRIVSSKSAAAVAKKQLTNYYEYLNQVHTFYIEARDRTLAYSKKI